jgi:thiol-disulfide isomerase/thioredoxin
MKNRRWTLALLPGSAAALLLGLGLTWVRTPAPARAAAAAEVKSPEQLEGKPAPDFSLDTLDGKKIKLSDLKKNVVVLDFWATWCPPCRKSLPHVEEVSKKKDLADKGLKVLAVNAQEDKAKVEKFMKDNNFTFTVPMDKDGKVMQDYGIQGIPTTIVVSRGGKVHKVFVGFGDDSPKQLDKAIEEAMKEGGGKEAAARAN